MLGLGHLGGYMASINSHAKPRLDAASSKDVVEVLRVQSADDKRAQPSASSTPSTTQSVADQLKARRVFTKAHWETQAIRDVHEELIAGRVTPGSLPSTFLESERIVNPLSREGVTFQNAMENLSKRLLPEIDQTTHPITFVIADAGQENAYILTTPKQSLICFDRKLLSTFENLDQLSWVLLHELTHLQYKDLFGAAPATQTEEALCDLRPLIKMREAGLNAGEAETYATKMAKTKQPAWLSMVDAHGLPPFRVDAIQKGLAALRHSRGKIKEGTDPLPENLRVDGELRGARHQSFVERTLEASTYAERSNLEKATLLRSLLSDLKPHFHHRADDLGKQIRAITVDQSDKETRAVLIDMMDALIDNPSAFNTLHVRLRSVLDGEHQKKTRYYAPRLIQVAKAAKEFIEAEDDTTAHEKAAVASHFIQAVESLPAWQSLNWGSVDIPHFQLATERDYKVALREARSSGEDVVFPWHELAEAAKSDNQIARALLCLGTWDDRIYLSAGVGDIAWMATHLEVVQSTTRDSKHSYEATLSTPRDEEGDASRFQLISNGGGCIKKLASLADNQGIIKSNVAKRLSVALEQARIDEKALTVAATSPSETLSSATRQGALSFQDLPYHEFMRDPYAHLKVNEAELCPASFTSTTGSTAPVRAELRALVGKTTISARNLLSYFDGMLNVTTEPERTTYHAFIRDFFLNESTPFNFNLIHGRQVEQHGYSSVLQYALWVATDTHQLFTLEEKGTILSGHHDGSVLALARTASGLGKPETVDQLREVLDTYLRMAGIDQRPDGTEQALNLFLMEAISREVHEFLRDHRSDAELHKLLSAHGDWLQHVYRETAFDQSFVDYLKREQNWPTDPTTLGTIYRAIEGLGIFPDEQWRAAFANRVLTSIDRTTDATNRIDALENLLLGTPPKDVDIREGAITRWVTSVAAAYGHDDTVAWNTPNCSYLSNIQPLLDRVSEKGHSSIRGEMLNALGTTILAQRQVSHAIERAVLGPIDLSVTQSSGRAYGALQTAFSLIATAKENRFQMIHFLTRDLTQNRLRAFSKVVIEEGLATAQMLESNRSVDLSSSRNRRLVQLECKRLHENFWRAPIGYRAAFLEELLMPAEERLRDQKAGTQETFNKACDYVISQLLPLTDTRGQAIKYAPEAQRIVRAFLADGVMDHRQQPIFLSALMAAAQRSTADRGNLSVGRTLASLFDTMGPAWRKFGQAIANHPSTPIDIARDMEPLKGKQSVSRHEAWALYEHSVPEDIRLLNPRLGPVLESASFFTAVVAGNQVFTFLTPNALVRAEDGFSIMESFVAELRKADDSFSQIAPAVAEMVHSARTSAILETNGRVGAAQADVMRARYNNLTVTIGKEQFPFSTAAWSDHGPEFRRMQKMAGPTLNDLPSTTAEETLHKRQVAKAIVYVELRNILSGNAFCVDRHGRNIRVDGSSVGHFDHGAVHAVVRDKKGNAVHPLDAEQALVGGGSVEVPGATHTEKLQLAEALHSAYTQLNGGQPLAVVMHTEIEKARAATGATPDYLIRVERALLAMNDCFKCLDGQDMKDILGSLYLNGDIHQTIIGALESKIKSERIGGFAGFFVNASKVIRSEIEKIIVERVTVTQSTQTQVERSQWHDNAMNSQDVPSLLTTKDFKPRKTKGASAQARRRSLMVPALEGIS